MTNDDKTAVNAPIWPKPPVIAFLFLLAGLALNFLFPLREPNASLPLENLVVGCVIVVSALAVIVFAWREMDKAQTTIMPGQPANALVMTGVFRRSRNPIYLGFVLILLGVGIAQTNPWMIGMAALLVVTLQQHVVKREEAYLAERFGSAYEIYKRQTRRWF